VIAETTSAETIGPYRILRRIGRGSTAEVFAVEERGKVDSIALKWAGPDPAHRERFAREVEVMARLNHPSMVRMFDFGEHEGRPWFTMERVIGTPLHKRVRTFGAPGEAARTLEVTRLIGRIASALDYVHSRGVLHRDLKSDNVLVLPDGRVKLVDFGSATCADPSTRLSDEGAFVGTFAYASPEQLASSPLEERSDIYSLGVLAYRLFTGQLPFQHEDPIELARLHAGSVPVPLSERLSSFPDELNRLVQAMMDKRPSGRPRSQEVAAACHEYLARAGGLDAGNPQVCWSPGTPLERHLSGAARRWRAVASGQPLIVVGGPGSGRADFVRALGEALSEAGEGVITALGGAGETGLAEWREQMRPTSEAPQIAVVASLSASFTAVREAWVPAIRATLASTPPVRWIIGVSEADGPVLRALESAFGGGGTWRLRPYTLDEVTAWMRQVTQRVVPNEIATAVFDASGGWLERVEKAFQASLPSNDTPTPAALPTSNEETSVPSTDMEPLTPIERRILWAVAFLGPRASRGRVAGMLGMTPATFAVCCAPLLDAGSLSDSEQDVLMIPSSTWRSRRFERFDPARRHALALTHASGGARGEPAPEVLGDIDAAVRRLRAWGHHGILECLDGSAEDWLKPADAKLGPDGLQLLAATRFVRSGHPAFEMSGPSSGGGPEAWLLRAYQEQAAGRIPASQEALDLARQRCDEASDPGLASAVAVMRAQLAVRCGKLAGLSEQFETAGRLAELSGVGAFIAHAEAASANFLLSRGEIGEAERLAARALERTNRGGEPCHHGTAWAAWAQAVCAQGRVSEARAALEGVVAGGLRVSHRPVNLHRHAQLLLALGRCELVLHRLGPAERRLDDLEALLSASDPFSLRDEVAVLRGRVLVASGCFEAAMAHCSRSLDDGAGTPRGTIEAQLRATLAEAYAGQGERAKASTLFQRALDALTAAGDRFAAAEVAAARLRALADAEDPDSTWREAGDAMASRGGLLFALEYRIAKGRYLMRRGDDAGVKRVFREGAAGINRWAAVLDANDQAALRFHPWSRTIRRALRST
jgi:tetratricopeptide (TPR) repeat protein